MIQIFLVVIKKDKNRDQATDDESTLQIQRSLHELLQEETRRITSTGAANTVPCEGRGSGS